FGLVMVDLEVPEDLRSAFDRFPPIFVNREVGRNNIGPFMRQFAVENNLLKQPRRCLVSLHKAKRVLLISDLIRWYLDAGLIVTQVYFALQYKPRAWLSHIGERIIAVRRAADSDDSIKILAELEKLIGLNFFCLTYHRSLIPSFKI